MPTTRVPQSGDVWLVDFSPQVGREQAGLRPGLVISNDQFNRLPNDLHIVVPITSTDRGLTFQVRVAPPEGGLTKPSVIMCDQEKAQSIERFQRYIGRVTQDTLSRVRQAVERFLEETPSER